MAVPKLDDFHLIRRLVPQEGTFEGLEEVAKSIGQGGSPSSNVVKLAKRIQTAGGSGGFTLNDPNVAGSAVAFASILATDTAVALGIEGKEDVLDSAVYWAFLFGLGLGHAVAAGRV